MNPFFMRAEPRPAQTEHRGNIGAPLKVKPGHGRNDLQPQGKATLATPENVARCIEQTRPYGVDVSTGVEASPGKKDPGKLRDFIAAARSAE